MNCSLAQVKNIIYHIGSDRNFLRHKKMGQNKIFYSIFELVVEYSSDEEEESEIDELSSTVKVQFHQMLRLLIIIKQDIETYLNQI